MESDEAIIWTMRVSNPENYGVVITNADKEISGFSEKPETFISDEAIIGIYYFRKAELLKEKIEVLFNRKMLVNGEYQLTDALELLLKEKVSIKSANISKWLDCGNKNEFLNSAENILNRENQNTIKSYKNTNIIAPVYLGKNVTIEGSTIGPYVIVEDDTVISGSKIRNSIIYGNCNIENSETTNSIVGYNSSIRNAKGVLNVGDYSTYENI
jgi:glucose-1-phosphate thymidylyltransferase